MSVLSRRCRHALLAIVAVAPLLAARTAHAQLAPAENDGRIWGVHFRLTDLDDEPVAPVVPVDELTDDPFTDDGDLAAITAMDEPALVTAAQLDPERLFLELLHNIPGPAATVVIAALEAPAIEPTQLIRQSRTPTSISGVRRSPVVIQPIIRGYQQQSIYAQYQGAQFVPVRFDLDSILTSIDPGLIDNLVIIPGPYGVKYGPGLAFIDVQAKPLPRFDVPTLHGRTSVFYQGAGKQFYGNQVLSGGGREYGYRAVYGHKIGDDYTSGNGTLIPSAYHVRDVDFSIARDLNDGSTIQIEYLRQDMTDTKLAAHYFDIHFRKTDGLFLRYTDDDGYGGARWLAEAWWNHTVMAGDDQGNLKRWFYNDIPPYRDYRNLHIFTDAHVTSQGCRLAPTWGEADQLELTVGIDIRRIDQEVNQFLSFDGLAYPTAPFGSNSPIPRSHMTDLGAFLEAGAPMGRDWRLTVGGRIDWVRTYLGTPHVAHDPNGWRHPSYLSEFTVEELLLHAFISSELRIVDGLDLRLGLGHGERAAGPTERFVLGTFHSLVQSAYSVARGSWFRGPDLKAEGATQFDIALIGDYDRLRFQMMGFCSFIDDHITVQGFTGPVAIPILDFINADSLLTGVELSADYDWKPALTPFASLRYVSGRNLERGEPLPSIFPLESRVGIRWHDPDRNRYGVEFNARIVDEQDRVAESLAEEATPGFCTFDLRGYWQARENLRFTSGFENLTNENYREHLSVRVPAVLEPGLNFYFTAQLDY